MSKYAVSRSIVINAPIDDVYARIVDYSTWTTWSPWLFAEPEAKVTVSDNPNSVGSLYQWEGEVTGSGELEHQQLTPNREIVDEIRFFKPFKSKSVVRFLFQSVDGGTKVEWQMNGRLPWFMFWMVGMMDTFIGRDYERGLKMLKEWIETGDILSKTEVQGMQGIGPLRMAGLRQVCSLDELGPSMQQAYPQVCQKFSEGGLPTENGIAVYHKFDMKKKVCQYTCGFLISTDANIPAGLEEWQLPQVNALKVKHTGSYDHLGNAWSAAMQVQRYRKLKLDAKKACFELYVNSPDQVATADLETDIYLPLK